MAPSVPVDQAGLTQLAASLVQNPSNRIMREMALQYPVQQRIPQLRPGRTLRGSGRDDVKIAILAQAVGVIPASPCNHCAKGCRIFDTCVTTPGFYGGACANCRFGGNTRYCSFILRPAANQASGQGPVVNHVPVNIPQNINPVSSTANGLGDNNNDQGLESIGDPTVELGGHGELDPEDGMPVDNIEDLLRQFLRESKEETRAN